MHNGAAPSSEDAAAGRSATGRGTQRSSGAASERRLRFAGLLLVGLSALAVAVGLTACGASAGKRGGAGSSATASGGAGSSATASGAAGPGTAAGANGAGNHGFAWLHPQGAPTAWKLIRIASGAELAYPANWSHERSDAGTATAVLVRSKGDYLGYLNLTPRQGAETLSNWSSFRVEHNRKEGDRRVRSLAAATGLQFLTGRGSCVKDAYTTATNARFIEIACLVAGSRTQSVIVGAAPPGRWDRMAAVIERAIEALRT